MATKDHKRHAREMIEALESRVHVGPPIHDSEIRSTREFLRENDFSPASDYFNRLVQIQDRLRNRSTQPLLPAPKRNYGGQAAGYWMQLLCAYDHVILSTCYDGELDLQRGRVKISHRFNQEGRIDFVELKFLCSLHPCLNGELRKLIIVRDYSSLQKDWHAAEASVLPILPRELIFLYGEIFHCPRNEVLAWLINIGHRMAKDLVRSLAESSVNGWSPDRSDRGQLPLEAVRHDEIALPILESAGSLESKVELTDRQTALVRYSSR